MPHVTAADRRPQLVRAAIRVMTRDGVTAATTRAIAAELGIAQATVHYAYGSKAELYRAVIEQLSADTAHVVRLRPTRPGTAFRVSVAACAAGIWQTVVTQTELHQLLMELYVVAMRAPSLRATMAEFERQLEAAFEDMFRAAAACAGIAPARPIEEISRFFAAGLDGLILHRLARDDDAADEQSLEHLVSATTALAEGRVQAAA